MDLLEIAVGLLEKGGAVAGASGGFIATRMFTRVQKGLNDAAAALVNARLAQERADEALTAVKTLKEELVSLQASFTSLSTERRKVPRISHAGLDDARVAGLDSRLVALETRASSLEDDFDAKAKIDQQSWEAIQRAVGRIEGSLQGILQQRESRS